MVETTTSPGAALDAAVRAAITALVADPSSRTLYDALTDKKARSRVRDAVTTKARSTLEHAPTDDLEKGMAALIESKRLHAVAESIKSGRPAKVAAADPFQYAADRAATLRLAADLIVTGVTAPEGVEPAVFDEEFVGHADYGTAVMLAGKLGERSANKFKTESGFAAAFAGKPIGTVLKVSEVRNAWIAVGGPKNADGRLSARLGAENGCTIPWVEFLPETATRKKSAKLTGAIPEEWLPQSDDSEESDDD